MLLPARSPRIRQPLRLRWPILVLAGLGVAVPGARAQAADVVVRLAGVIASQTRVYVSLCQTSLLPDDCGLNQIVAADAPDLTVRFEGVAPGIYAVAAFQDLNGDGVLNRSPHGLPREPYGFSREAGRVATPRFERASFPVERDMSVQVRLAAPGRP